MFDDMHDKVQAEKITQDDKQDNNLKLKPPCWMTE